MMLTKGFQDFLQFYKANSRIIGALKAMTIISPFHSSEAILASILKTHMFQANIFFILVLFLLVLLGYNRDMASLMLVTFEMAYCHCTQVYRVLNCKYTEISLKKAKSNDIVKI